MTVSNKCLTIVILVCYLQTRSVKKYYPLTENKLRLGIAPEQDEIIAEVINYMGDSGQGNVFHLLKDIVKKAEIINDRINYANVQERRHRRLCKS